MVTTANPGINAILIDGTQTQPAIEHDSVKFQRIRIPHLDNPSKFGTQIGYHRPVAVYCHFLILEDSMRKFVLLCLSLGLAATTLMPNAEAAAPAAGTEKSIYDFTLKSIDGQTTPLSEFHGKVVLLVNVASRCGFTPQYTALESVYEKYKSRGLVIVGIPANNFAGQEPGTNEEIKTFCTKKYNVSFPMMSKVSVSGEDKTPLYQFLTGKGTDPKFSGEIKWNFTKFLFDRNGNPVARFEPAVTPDSTEVTAAIEAALGH
jgi:glutathione peroxidase